MTCRELASFIMAYLNEELAVDVREAFDRHLSVCPNCVRYLAQYRDTMAVGRRAFEETDADVPSSVPEDLVRAILAARPTE